jgi:pre-mRNA-splicing helicase BRR2
VLQADRSLIDRRARDEATGEVAAVDFRKLASQNIRMGDRSTRATPADLTERKAARARKAEQAQERKHTRSKLTGSLLSKDADLSLKYRPSTRRSTRTSCCSALWTSVSVASRTTCCAARPRTFSRQ